MAKLILQINICKIIRLISIKEVIIIEQKYIANRCKDILTEIKYLRNMQNFLIDSHNSNRYRIIVKEPVGYTAYCFSAPIYNIHTRKLVHPYFERTHTNYSFVGSNGTVFVKDNECIFQNQDGRAIITFNEQIVTENEHIIQSNVSVSPTLNGLLFTVNSNNLKFILKSEAKQDGIRYSSNSFSLMKEVFKPFISVSALYASDDKESLSPVEISYKHLSDQSYEVCLFHGIQNGIFTFEINLYEPKLFQDTTVESIHPDSNNAYGSIGFIGKTTQFGEQWLYSRPDFSKIPDLLSEQIDHAFLHIPLFSNNSNNIDVFIPEKRFCSFGSTWNTKVNAATKFKSVNSNNRYLTIDATPLFTNRTDRTLVYNDGLILRKQKDSTFTAISTGDCYFAPQILEIKFK